MRFLDGHILVNKLTKIDICDKKIVFLDGTRGDYNPYYLRGQRFTVDESLLNSII